MSKQITAAELWQPAFNSVWNEIAPYVIGKKNRGGVPKCKYDELFLQGGRASGKSVTASVFVWLTVENDPDKNAVVLRKVGSSIRKSCWKQMMKTREKLELFHWEPNKTELTFTNRYTGQQIFFVGLDDEEKVRSITVEKGYLSIAWFEEAKQFSSMEEIDQAVSSILRGGADDTNEIEKDYDADYEGDQEYLTILTYNPPKSNFDWINREARINKSTRLCHKSTYLTMPRRWLGSKVLNEIEQMKRLKPEQYKHMYLGMITGTGGEYFKNVRSVTFTDEDIANFKYKQFGCDWGLIDPNVWLAMYYEDGVLRIFDEIYQDSMPDDDENKYVEFARLVKAKMIKYGCELDEIWCDAQGKAERSILREEPFNLQVEFAPKQGVNGRKEGYKWYQSLLRIEIDPARCPHAYEEFSMFEAKMAPNGQGWLDEPGTKGDHCPDAGRYGMWQEIQDGVFGCD